MLVGRLGRELRRWRRRGTRNRLPPERSPLPLGKDPVEIHTLVCARDFVMSVWSLQSFIAFSGLLPTVVVHDDGTLTDEHRALYERIFDSIVVLDEGRTRERMDEALAPWPACRRFHRLPGFFCSRKLFDPLFLARSETILVLDSDVLFFGAPLRLLDHLAAGSACFGSDYQDAYTMPRAELSRWAGRSVLTRFNAGLMAIPVEAYRGQLDLVECFLAYAERELKPPDVNVHEQTAHCLAMSALGAARLPPDYALIGPLDAKTVSYHFMGDGRGRKRFYDEGVARIERELAARLERTA
jgi:hypothetical protein